MDEKAFLDSVAGYYEVKEFGRVTEGDTEMSLYFPPVGMKRRLYPAFINGAWVGKFNVVVPPGGEPVPLAAKIAHAIYHVVLPNSLRCDRIPVMGNLWVQDDIIIRPTGGSGGRRELVHNVQFFAGNVRKAVGEWICPD